jgi:hypothetical protein
MSNGDNLYFIRILQEAFKSPDSTTSLKSALEAIISMGKDPNYRKGFKNFQGLMKVIDKYAASEKDQMGDIKSEMLRSRIIDFITDTFEGTDEERRAIIGFIAKNPELASEFKKMQAALEAFLPGPPAIEIEIEKNGMRHGAFKLGKDADSIMIGDIQPGDYIIKLSTGLYLWQGRLNAEDVLWRMAFPGRKLPAAAETKAIRQDATVAAELLDGEAKLEVFPGLETGTMLLTFKRANGI